MSELQFLLAWIGADALTKFKFQKKKLQFHERRKQKIGIYKYCLFIVHFGFVLGTGIGEKLANPAVFEASARMHKLKSGFQTASLAFSAVPPLMRNYEIGISKPRR
ncbi:hypothetical protein [Martelella soudanensis]|uniref:hypothetical protein n=1 Tax=unclassified Martelella TaxID=2629616 RepID=UPI0015DE74DA|nr:MULTISPECIES: hypothetical protein [unclassified Martelella]